MTARKLRAVKGTEKVESVKQLEQLYTDVVSQMGRRGMNEYGLKNMDEFLAMAFTDRDFQRTLSKISMKGGGNAKTRFIKIIKDFLGLTRLEDSALAHVIEHGAELIGDTTHPSASKYVGLQDQGKTTPTLRRDPDKVGGVKRRTAELLGDRPFRAKISKHGHELYAEPPTGKSYDEILDAKRLEKKGPEVDDWVKGVKEDLAKAASMPINPSKADDPKAIAKAIANNFTPTVRRMFNDTLEAERVAGASITAREDYFTHVYNQKFSTMLAKDLTSAALRETGPAGDAAWKARFGMNRKQWDAKAAKELGLPKGYGRFSDTVLAWADNEADLVPRLGGAIAARKGRAPHGSGRTRAIPGSIDTKNKKLRKLFADANGNELDFNPLETDTQWLIQERIGNRAGRTLGGRASIDKMMQKFSYTGKAAPEEDVAKYERMLAVIEDGGSEAEIARFKKKHKDLISPRPENAGDLPANKVIREAFAGAGLDPAMAEDMLKLHEGRFFPGDLAEELSREIAVHVSPAAMGWAVRNYKKMMGEMSKYTLVALEYAMRNRETGLLWKNAVHSGMRFHSRSYDQAGQLLDMPATAAVAKALSSDPVRNPVQTIKHTATAAKETGKTAVRGASHLAHVAPGAIVGGASSYEASDGDLLSTAAGSLLGAEATGRMFRRPAKKFRDRVGKIFKGGNPDEMFDMGARGMKTRRELEELIAKEDWAIGKSGTTSGASLAASEGAGALDPVHTATRKLGRNKGERYLKKEGAVSATANTYLDQVARDDQLHRVAMGLDLYAQGVPVKEISRRVTRLHFDMDVLGKAERGTPTGLGLRDLGFFFTYRRKSIPLGVKLAIEDPRKHYLMYKGYQTVGDWRTDENTPKWMRELIRFSIDSGGERQTLTRLGTPYDDTLNLATQVWDALDELGGEAGITEDPLGSLGRTSKKLLVETAGVMLAPPAKTPLEMAFGWDAFYSQPLELIDTMPKSWANQLWGLNPEDMTGSQRDKRVKVAYRAYHLWRSLLPPVMRPMNLLGEIAREGEGGVLANQIAPGRMYTYKQETLDWMMSREYQDYWNRNIWDLAKSQNWLRTESPKDVKRWSWSAAGRKTPFFRRWKQYKQMKWKTPER